MLKFAIICLVILGCCLLSTWLHLGLIGTAVVTGVAVAVAFWKL